MANNQLPLDTTQSKQTQRKAAIEIIEKKFSEANVEVLNPEELLKDNDATGASNLDSGIAAGGGANDQYNCVTEPFDPSSVASILVGLFREIPRWKSRHTINFAAYAGGYPQPGDAEYAALRLWDAAKEWNSYELGVNFAWVGDLEKATFVLEYGGDKGTVLASAFFPNSQPLNTLFVYQLALLPTDRYRGMLKNIFLHELGHTLGLRHEFALDPDRFEGGAVVYGSRNEKSVMSYNFPPQVQPSDITDVQNFYKLDTLTIETLRIKDYIPG
ncbi:matrix metallo proteinase-11 [Fusarium oxysporum]|nr:matrix metallo proteinase-11 [Fusarium oxysporum]